MDSHLFDTQPLGLGTELHPSYDTIPVALGLISDTVGVLSHPDVLDTIVDTHLDGVSRTQLDIVSHIKEMWGRQRIVATYLMTIDKHRCLDMRALQKKGNMFLSPRFRHIDTTSILRNAHIMLLGCQEEGEFYMAILPILLHIGIKVITGVVERTRPSGVHRHWITHAIGLHRTR